MQLTILSNTDSCLLYKLPDDLPMEPPEEISERHPEVSSLSFGYIRSTFQSLQMSTGGVRFSESTELMRIQEIFLRWKKSSDSYFKIFPKIFQQLLESTPKTEACFSLITLDNVSEHIRQAKLDNEDPWFIHLLSTFQKQAEFEGGTFYDFIAAFYVPFLLGVKTYDPASQQILIALNEYPELQLPSSTNEWLCSCSEENLAKRRIWLNASIINSLVVKYACIKTDWNPSLGIKSLQETLKNRGPMAIFEVDIGEHRYEVAPVQSTQKIGDHFIYYFPKGSIHKNSSASKSILVLGVDSLKNHIYFCNPSCHRKTFVITFERFNAFIKEKQTEFSRAFPHWAEKTLFFGLHSATFQKES